MTYLDAASAEPVHPAAERAMVAALKDGWADPSRLYGAGRRARLALDAARQHLAEAIGARPDELAFTGSGTLACHLAVLGTLAGRRRVGTHVVVSAVEHSSVLNAAKEYAGEVTTVPVDRLGRVDPGEFTAALRADTALACLQSANHEVGTVQPVAEVAPRCAEL
ncbi:MAG TPA: aminotransferase class V-fold PLP-dependent enzyme, partial [Actinomycetes bacterium]